MKGLVLCIAVLCCRSFARYLDEIVAAEENGVQEVDAEDKSIYDQIEKLNKNSSVKLFEGDIYPNQFEKKVVDGKYPTEDEKREARRYRAYLWRTRVVPYVIASDFDEVVGGKQVILDALKVFEEKTCLKFKPHTNESNWILFKRLSGCYSSVGREYWKNGGQIISLGKGCLTPAKIMHEVMHSLGFWHEQSRPDRDKFIEIFWENIDPAEEHNFKKYSHLSADQLGVNYDYQTLMHYGSKTFSKNGKQTIKAIGNDGVELGGMLTLSASDTIQINALYDCTSKDSSIWSAWSEFGPCDTSCDRSRHRFCSHKDLSQCKNANIFGIETDRKKCSNVECYAPIDGHWGRWSSWASCSVPCGPGKKSRTRTCDNPKPQHGGKACPGSWTSFESCQAKRCELGPNDCEFEGDGFCTWTDISAKSYKWTRTNKPTPSRGTGPSYDHSTGKGHFIFTEASTYKGKKARIISKQFEPTKGLCLSFWYHMYGMSMGSLNVIIKSKGGPESVIWNTAGDKGDQWIYANKTITSPMKFQVIFEAVKGSGWQSDIALDDIFFQQRKCERSNLEKLCGLTIEPIGCFADSMSDRVMSQLLHLRRHLIVWDKYNIYLQGLLCECARHTKNKGYTHFGLQYYGECWSAKGEVNVTRYGASNNCVDGRFKQCSLVRDKPCVGGTKTNYVYQLLK